MGGGVVAGPGDPESPDEEAGGEHLDAAVHPEADERNAAGDHPGADSDDGLDDIPADREPLEAERPAMQVPFYRQCAGFHQAASLVVTSRPYRGHARMRSPLRRRIGSVALNSAASPGARR